MADIKNLVIVESPAKAKTIEKFLGKDFTVESCFGHIRDLVKGNLGVHIEKDFEPVYEISDDKKAVVKKLKDLAKKSETVWLASDEDREGEAISWHLAEVLQLDKKNTKRIVFHEITKPAIQKAIENPRTINQNLVNAQQARRVLDRLVGFELSPILWKKLKPSLSAGRVQSVSVRLLVEREREISNFNTQSYYRVVGEFSIAGDEKKIIKAELSERFKTEAEARSFLESCIGDNFSVDSTETKPARRSPSAPFTTSTLQQEASRKLGFSVSQTMVIAQKLYEAGLITYMRTDSVNLSEQALASAKSEISKNFGANYSQTRKYVTKQASAQEAHEAIRPTYFDRQTIEGDSADKRLYDLIWKRTIASQMADAQLEKTTIGISGKKAKGQFVATGEVIKFDGFLKVYLEGTDDDGDEENSGLLPPVKQGTALNARMIQATQRFTRPAARYTEASLVKKLEELGIGRPSTYAPTISTIIRRGYAIKEDRPGKERPYRQLTLANNKLSEAGLTENTGAEKSKLFPTDIGTLVTDFLNQHFESIMDYNFTAEVEKEFDDIAEGMKQWTGMIRSFYEPFHKNVDNTLETAARVTGERELGIDPASGEKVIVRMGRFGPVAQIGENTDTKKARFASLRAGQMMEQVTLEDALELFKLPRVVGTFESKEIKASVGKFGPYLLHDSKFISIPKGEDPLEITEERAIEVIEAKRVSDANKIISDFKNGIQVLRGRWGPYISEGKNNFKIPKKLHDNAAKLSLDEVREIMKAEAEAAGDKPKKTTGKRFAKAKK